MARKANTQQRPVPQSGEGASPENGTEPSFASFASPFAALKNTPVSRAKAREKKKERPPRPAPSSPRDEDALFDAAMRSATPLRGRGKISPAKPADPLPADPLPAGTPAPGPDDEERRIFATAMAGVAPVKAGGRDLNPGPGDTPAAPPCAHEDLDELLHGTLEFALAYSEEFIEGRVLGLDPLVMGKLRSGQFSHEGHLDLHGRNVEQAYASLGHFLRESYQAGKRHLLLITGRGRNSPGGAPVLRERIRAWLTRDPFRRVVLAFCTAKPRDGGAGAVYVLIRKRKKNQGKIVWDRMPTEEELLR
jgi:DNA-nicking Smr family endonuclease